MRARWKRTALACLVVAGAFTLAAVSAGGCAPDREPATSPDVDAVSDTGFDDTQVHPVEVGEDASSTSDLCGVEKLCDPDVAAICTPFVTDSGADGDAEVDATPDAADAPDAAASDAEPDDGAGSVDAASETGAGSLVACRVTKRDNLTVAACAPAGKVPESQFCASDDDCAPGLACVGAPGLGRCLRYCCGAWSSPETSPDAGGGTHYCTPRPLAARPTEKVPVLVKLDDCTLLEDELQCPEGDTCTVVTNDGRTTCVPAVPGQVDFAPCADQGCDKGYVCLGTEDRRCRKLCRESEGSGACPGGGYCQRVPTIPDGYGICAGGDAGT